jgi:thioredoxin 1
MSEVHDVTDQTFEQEVIESDIPVIVDFWGEHCPPCRVIAPILRDFAGEYDGRVKIVKLNSDENGDTMIRYQVMALPTILAFSDGTVVGQIVGARPKKDFKEIIETALST